MSSMKRKIKSSFVKIEVEEFRSNSASCTFLVPHALMSARGGSSKRARTGGSKRKAGGGAATYSSSSSSTTLTASAQHAAQILDRIDQMRLEHPELCDLLIRPGGGGAGVPAHANVMAAASPYVMAQLTRWHNDPEGSSGASSLTGSAASGPITITVPDIEASALNAAVEFAYTGTVALNTNDTDAALPLLVALQFLDMPSAQTMVEGWVSAQLDPSTALRVRHFAQHYNMGDLEALAEAYFDTHFEAVTKTEEWRMLSAAEVEKVLTRDHLQPGGELNVFHALVRWAQRGGAGGGEVDEGGAAGGGDAGGGGEQDTEFEHLLEKCVRMPRMSSHDLRTVVIAEPLVQKGMLRGATTTIHRVLRERTASPSQQVREPPPPHS